MFVAKRNACARTCTPATPAGFPSPSCEYNFCNKDFCHLCARDKSQIQTRVVPERRLDNLSFPGLFQVWISFRRSTNQQYFPRERRERQNIPVDRRRRNLPVSK